MLLPNPAIDEDALARAVDTEFGLDGNVVVFQPVGGDSWCYRAGPWWASVRRDRRGHRPGAYEAMRAFADEGCDLFLAPVRGASGRVVHEVSGRPVVVFPYLDVRVAEDEAAVVSEVVRTLHDLEVSRALAGLLGSESYKLFYEAELDAALERALGGAVDAGPYGARTAELLQANREPIAAMRAEMSVCQAECRAWGDAGFVLTHGEPDGAVMVTDDGQVLLGDGGELMLGPRERDGARLRMMGADFSGRTPALRFYELLWILGEIAEYGDRFTSPHPGDEEDDEKFLELFWYLDEVAP